MGTFLDLRSSMNASTTITEAVPTTPTLFGIIGLQTQNVANPIVALSGTIGLSTVGPATAVINIVRGASLTAGPIIYTAVVSTVVADVQIVSFNAQDLLAPAALETAYSAFISAASLLTVTRIGPEAFYGIASQG